MKRYAIVTLSFVVLRGREYFDHFPCLLFTLHLNIVCHTIFTIDDYFVLSDRGPIFGYTLKFRLVSFNSSEINGPEYTLSTISVSVEPRRSRNVETFLKVSFRVRGNRSVRNTYWFRDRVFGSKVPEIPSERGLSRQILRNNSRFYYSEFLGKAKLSYGYEELNLTTIQNYLGNIHLLFSGFIILTFYVNYEGIWVEFQFFSIQHDCIQFLVDMSYVKGEDQEKKGRGVSGVQVI